MLSHDIRSINMADEKPPAYPDVEQNLVDDKDGAPPAVIVKHANDADEAMKAFEGHGGEILILDEATNKRLLRKIDLNILPVIRAHGHGKGSANGAIAAMRCLWSQLP